MDCLRGPRKSPTSISNGSKLKAAQLLDLPVELRLDIFDDVLQGVFLHVTPRPGEYAYAQWTYLRCTRQSSRLDGHWIPCCPYAQSPVGWYSKWSSHSPLEPAVWSLLLSCRTLYVELVGFLYSRALFDFHSLEDYLDFARYAPTTALQLKHIRTRHIDIDCPFSRGTEGSVRTQKDRTFVEALKRIFLHTPRLESLRLVIESTALWERELHHQKNARWARMIVDLAKLRRGIKGCHDRSLAKGADSGERSSSIVRFDAAVLPEAIVQTSPWPSYARLPNFVRPPRSEESPDLDRTLAWLLAEDCANVITILKTRYAAGSIRCSRKSITRTNRLRSRNISALLLAASIPTSLPNSLPALVAHGRITRDDQLVSSEDASSPQIQLGPNPRLAPLRTHQTSVLDLVSQIYWHREPESVQAIQAPLQQASMLQFSSNRSDWRLDAVSILAILGESNIKLNSHLITSTRLCYLPRLMPAPQGLLGERRMKQLPQEEDVKVVGVFNGNKSEGLNYFATLLHEKALQDASFIVRTIDIYSEYLPKHRAEVDIRRKDFGPLNVITIMSFVLTLALLFYALALGDGPGFIGVSVMSLTSTLLCAASHWKPILPTRKASRDTIPKGDVVIRTRKGSFLVVHCNEIIARKLYFAPEECEYRMSSTAGRATGGLAGGLVMMGAVILFGNCSWPLQVALGVSYAVLNAAYWSTTVCPSSWTWDFSDFKVIDRGIAQNKNYTGALAAAIRETKTTKWVLGANFSPSNAAWRDWLKQADLNMDNDGWWRDSSQDTSLRPNDRTHFQGTLTWLLAQHHED